MQLETKRLSIRPFELEDAPFVLGLLNEPSFHEHIGDKGVCDLDGARRYLEEGPLASYARHGFGLLHVALRDTGEPIGMAGLLRREGLDDPDLGYALVPGACGRGLALEAADAVMRHARDVLGIGRVLAVVGEGNVRSIRLLEKLGFVREGEVVLPPDDDEVALYAEG